MKCKTVGVLHFAGINCRQNGWRIPVLCVRIRKYGGIYRRASRWGFRTARVPRVNDLPGIIHANGFYTDFIKFIKFTFIDCYLQCWLWSGETSRWWNTIWRRYLLQFPPLKTWINRKFRKYFRYIIVEWVWLSLTRLTLA